jgi:DNA-binding NarL/FixJ family response regulator
MEEPIRTYVHIIEPFPGADSLRRIVESEGRQVRLWGSLSEALSSKHSPMGVHILAATDSVLEACHPGAATSILGMRIIVAVGASRPASEEYWVRRGCMGVLAIDTPPSTFAQCVAAVAADEIWASRRTVSYLVREYVSSSNQFLFTSRESEILGLMATGRSNHQIATDLCISRETVRWHLRSIYKKSGIHGRKEAAQVFVERYREAVPDPA